MCCRYTTADLEAVRALLHSLGLELDCRSDDLPARFNAAPRDTMPVVVQAAGRRLRFMRFGLDAARGAKPALLVNARAETLLDRPAFRDAALHRRCLVPADGFYEWEKAADARLPHYFTLKNRRAFFLAGLWQRAPGGDEEGSFCVVTTTANAVLAPIHDRMPVMLGPNSGPRWLGNAPLPPAELSRLCRPLPAEMMISRRVAPRVNNARYKLPDCIAPA